MGASTKTVGGSGQQGQDLSSDFLKTLQQLLGGQSGGIGPGNPAGGNAFGSTAGAAGVLQDILGQGAGNIGGALQQLLQRTQDRDVNKIKEGFRASGGAQFGTPGAYAEGMYRGEAAPNITKAIGDLQLGAANNIMQLLGGVYRNETPQAQLQNDPGLFSQILQGVGSLAPLANLAVPGLGTAIGGISKAGLAATSGSVSDIASGMGPI